MKFRFFPLMEEGEGEGEGGGEGKPPKTGYTEAYVKSLREEAKSWRLKFQDAEAGRVEAVKQVEASTQVAADKIKEANASADQRVISAKLEAAAVRAGMVDLDGLKLADLSKVKLGEDGQVVGADELMASMKKAKPYLFGTESSSSTHDKPPPGDQKPKKISEMTPEERKADAKARGISGPM